MVVTAADGHVYETHLGAVQPHWPKLDALPDGGFVLADARSKAEEQHVQVFDALGRPSWMFRMGDAIEHLLADASGDPWVGYFDEGVYGNDPLSHPGLRRWSSDPGGDGTGAQQSPASSSALAIGWVCQEPIARWTVVPLRSAIVRTGLPSGTRSPPCSGRGAETAE
ncbi:hypothetical protein [Streptomyces sp. NBC_00057]|uniref:hypothetical protein n=1 Tax=Streptomyces sp. NBC_00057 TaxID=2975634 RepID=UPI00325085A1